MGTPSTAFTTTEQAPAPRRRAWRLWQALALPLSYPIFALGALMMIALVPVAMLGNRSRRARIRWLRTAMYRGARVWVRVAELLQVLEVEIDDRRPPGVELGARNTPSSSPVLVIANHPSLIDVLLITATVPNLCCVLKGALSYNPLFRLLINQLDYLPNSNPESMLAEGSRRLQREETLLIFPEGTRSEPGTELDFRFGAAELAVRSGCAVLPIVIRTNTAYLSKGYPWYRLPADKLRYTLEVGPAFASRPAEIGANRRKARRALNKLWLAHFKQRLDRESVGN